MAAEARLVMILRDFELKGLAERGALVRSICNDLQAAEPRAKFECDITEQYRNMRYWLEKDMRPVDLALEAMRQLDLTPVIRPIRAAPMAPTSRRGGCPAPTCLRGCKNYHGPLEWISVQDMSRAVEMCIKLAQLWRNKCSMRTSQVFAKRTREVWIS